MRITTGLVGPLCLCGWSFFVADVPILHECAQSVNQERQHGPAVRTWSSSLGRHPLRPPRASDPSESSNRTSCRAPRNVRLCPQKNSIPTEEATSFPRQLLSVSGGWKKDFLGEVFHEFHRCVHHALPNVLTTKTAQFLRQMFKVI